MGNLINFIEKLGASAELQQLSEAEVLKMMEKQSFTANSNVQLHAELAKILDARKNLVCGIHPAEEHDVGVAA